VTGDRPSALTVHHPLSSVTVVSTGPPPRPVLHPVPAPALEDLRFAVVDLETSGLSPRRHQILQVAVVVVDAEGRVLDRWASLVRPRHGVWSHVGPRHIHGITRRRLIGAPRLTAVLDTMTSLLDGAVFTAHNAAFDAAFLTAAARRCGIELVLPRQVCTLQLSRRLDPGRSLSHRLGDACARHGILVDHPHDALADAQATAALLPHLIRAHEATTLDQLLAEPRR
jgi:DNA polymerase-3 subunit epsilon